MGAGSATAGATCADTRGARGFTRLTRGVGASSGISAAASASTGAGSGGVMMFGRMRRGAAAGSTGAVTAAQGSKKGVAA
jgi:hypothetical protein